MQNTDRFHISLSSILHGTVAITAATDCPISSKIFGFAASKMLKNVMKNVLFILKVCVYVYMMCMNFTNLRYNGNN